MKKQVNILFLFSLFTGLANAQTDALTSSTAGENLNMLFYVMIAFVLVVSLLVIAVVFYTAQILRQLARELALSKAEARGEVLKEQPNFWAKLNHWLTDSTPIEKEETIVLDHSYDGIRELDNHLPPWWKALLYGSIVWGAIYFFVYHVSDSLPLSAEEYTNELAYAEMQLQKIKQSDTSVPIDENTVTFTTNTIALQDGEKTFGGICASCHRPDGGGDIGPNLTDAYWKNGGSIKDIFKVISEGVPNTNMISWASSLSPEKMQNVASYIRTLQGTSPSGAKAPEGELYTPQQDDEKTESEAGQAEQEEQQGLEINEM